jgi:hypothetical protein
LLLEDLEQRRVMAAGPNLAGIQPDNGSLLTPSVVLSVSPRELNFKFTNDQGFGLDTTTLAGGIQLLRSGFDGEFATNSVTIKPGYIGLGDSNQEVVMRFAEPLPDDTYRVLIVGNNSLGVTPIILKDAAGNPYNGGNSDMVEFRLNLGAQVKAVVPQPVDRGANGLLSQRRDEIDVYFNEDKLDPTSATNKNFYQLILTSNTVSPVDDAQPGNVLKPTSVTYDPVANKVTLKFSGSLETLNPNNYAMRLRIGTDETIDGVVPPLLQANDPLSTFTGALNTGTLSGYKVYDDSIAAKPYDIQWPGGNDDPGHRDTPIDDEKHLADGQGDFVNGITIRYYNFKRSLGSISDGRGGFQQAFNTITENQKQRAREIFELYSRYSGIQFVESQDQGLTVATGDLRIADPTIPSAPGGVAGLGGGNIAVMDVAETWDDSYGGSWFQVAIHEIGHAIGLGHTYDLPAQTDQGSDGSLPGNSEPIFPGDNDIVHLQRIYRPEGQDIDMYKFDIAAGQSGTFSAETFSERLQNGTTLDTYLRLYKQGPNGPELVAINDDYFSKDSLIQLQLDGGQNGATYFLGVSAKGNEQYDPAAPDSGMGGTSEGAYRLSMNFRPTVTTQHTIVDATGVPLDGDSDGKAGGTFNFWFKTAAPIAQGQSTHSAPVTLFVDRSAANGGNGALTTPFNSIPAALAASLPGDIVRIVGNGGADGNINTLGDNLAYQLGFDQVSGAPLRDGASLVVPKNVTVMIDAGAIFQMRRSLIRAGSTQTTASTDRSGGALQVLGVPGRQVYFTSYNDTTGVGKVENPLPAPVAQKGDWGGILFRDDQDRIAGRFNWEEQGIFLNYVNYADMRYGGGQVNVDGGQLSVVTPIHIVDSRPTVSNNVITLSAEAAVSATPNSFRETTFHEPRYQIDGNYQNSFNVDYGRVGPEIHGNTLVQNTLNGLFVRTRTAAGSTLQELTVAGRFDDADITHILSENLVIRGTPSGPTLENGTPTAADPTITSGKPPITSVILTQQAGNGALAAGFYKYRLVFVDQYGNEGRPSDLLSITVNSSSSSVTLAQLPLVPVGSDFVGRRIYRAGADNVFRLVDQVASVDTTFVDKGAVPNFVRILDSGLFAAQLQRPRLDASLRIDPNVVVKLDAARIEVGMGATFIAEGNDGQEVIFTSLSDDRFGASGTFDTNSNGAATTGQAGQWGGIYASPNSKISLDYANILYGGGLTRTNGNFGGFNPVEIHQADARIAHSLFQFNGDGQGGTTNGRAGMATNATASIFVRGAQPIVVDNIIRDNRGAAININVNALNSNQVVDSGRQTGLVDRLDGHFDNNGPLVRDNRLSNNGIPGRDGYNGMIVRGAILTTEGVWDDTDIAHILLDQVSITDMHSFGGLRLESAAKESLVVKSLGATAGFYVNGRPLETDDRIGGMLHILGQQGFPVILTSLTDDTVGAGLTPDGNPLNDTNNDGTGDASGGLPTAPDVNNATRIDNNVSPNSTPGFLEVTPGSGGTLLSSRATAQGNTQLLLNQNFIFTHLNYIDIARDGLAKSLSDPSFNTFTQPPTRKSPDLVQSKGTFLGNNGPVNWTVETYLLDGDPKVYNRVTFDSDRALGDIRFINYLDQNIGASGNDDLLYLTGSPGQADFRAYTLDNADRVGMSQGGIYAPGANLVNATFDGFAADRYNDLETAIQGVGATYSLNGNIDTTSLPSFSDPALGTVYGLGDVTTAFAWTLNPAATTSTVTTFMELVTADPATKGQPGDWAGITIDKYSHDRNVDTVLEQEDSSSAATNANGTPLTSQLIGLLAPNEKSGDETRRLGFTVHGDINARNDVDVYSFKADAGTQVWIDLDRTTSSLDAVVELIDSDGFVLARSNDSYYENSGTQGLFGLGKVMQNTPPFEGRDFYTTNVRDPGMRLVLPGPAGANSEYFIRVRSNSGNLNTLNGGQTQGAYQLQLRLQEKDEFGGTVVRYADIRNAVNGIQVLGQPIHSPLSGEHGDVDENGGNNDSQGSAQPIGNAVDVDRGATSIAGMLSSSTDVDWYQFTLDIDKVQGFGEVSDPSSLLYSMIFDLDYADGLGRANAVLSVFNQQGQLVLSSRDSNIADDQPNTVNPGATDDLSRGSLGTADPYIGPAYLPAGLKGVVANNNNSRTYYVAVSSDARLPQQWEQYFTKTPANALARFQPVDSAKRIVEDHINEGGGQGAPRGTGQLADVQVMIDNNSFVPFNLGDVSLFINRNTNSVGQSNASELLTADPFTGASETWVGTQGGQQIYDIAFRNDEEMFAYSQGTANSPITDANSDDFIQIDTGTGAPTKVSDTGIRTYQLYPNGANPPTLDIAHDLGGPNRVGWGIQMEALMFANLEGDAADELLAVGNRGDGGFGAFPGQNLLFQMNPNTGAPLVNGTPVGIVPGNPPSYFGSLTSALELGVIDTTVNGGSGGLVTGMATIGGTIYAISDAGGLFTVSTNLAGQRGMSRNSPGIVDLVTTNYIASSEPELEGINFQALTAGPKDVEGGRYANLLFGVDDGGRMYAFNTAGELQPIFEGGATSIQLTIHSRDSVAPVPLTNVRGIAFGRLDENLWHTTPNRPGTPNINPQRQDDAGHGLDITFDGSVKPATADATEMEAKTGNSSLYFGDPNALVQNRKVRGGNGSANSYDAAGGAYGTVVSNEFSLKGYSASDQPVLYYNYFLDSEEAYDNPFENAGRQVRDSVKVYIAGNDGNWELVSGDYQEKFTDPLNNGLNSVGSRMWDSSGSWRQVRINLGDYAGRENLRLRFDFSTASDMNVGDTNTTGEEIRAVAGKYINDGDQFSIDGQRYEFESGVTIVTSSGSQIADGDTFSVRKDGVQATWEFDRAGDGVTSPNMAIPITGFETATEIATKIRTALTIHFGITPRWLNDNRVNLDFLTDPLLDGAVVNSALGLTTEGDVGVSFGALPVPFHRGMTRAEVAQQIDAVLEPVFSHETLVVRGTGANFNDGDTFTIQTNDGAIPSFKQTFEFQTPTGLPGVTPGNIQVDVDPSMTAGQVAQAIHDAISGFLGPNNIRSATYNAADQARVQLNGTGTERFVLISSNPVLEMEAPDQLLVQLPGSGYADGRTFTLQVDGQKLQTFEFERPGGGGVAFGNTPVNITSTMTPLQVTQAIQTAIQQFFAASGRMASVNTASSPSRVQLFGIGTERFTLQGNPTGLQITASNLVKTHGDLVRIIGHVVDFAGPLGWDNDLEGDSPADATDRGFFSNTRGQNNAFEGVYIDDIVIGLAERGEMVTGATNNFGFINNTTLQPNQNLSGSYQLEMRRGPDYGLPGRQGALFPVIDGVPASIDSNDRLNHSTSVNVPAGTDIEDGKTIVLSDGVNEVRFEFNVFGNNEVAPGNIAVNYNPDDTDYEVALKLRDAINSPAAQAVLTVSAQLADGTRPGLPSTNATVNIVGNATFQSYGIAPQEQNDVRSNATPLNLNEQSSFVIDAAIGDNPNRSPGQDVDMFKVFLFGGQTIYADVDTQGLGSTLNSYLRIFDGSTPLPAFDSDNDPAPHEGFAGGDSYTAFTAPSDGFYYVAVSGQGNQNYNGNTGAGSVNGSTGRYRLEISRSLPRTTDIVQQNNRPYGDGNLHREQGQLILEGNRISSSLNWGILVDDGARDSGTAPHQTAPRNLREVPNDTVPGVVIVNNIIFNNNTGGIRFSGNADVNGSELGAIPYGRIVNNTIFGKGGSLLQQPVGNDIGIQVDDRASPTLMNNIVGNFATGIFVDASSLPLGTVIGGTVYQGNIQNTNVNFTNSIEFNSITLTNADRLFVDPSVGNFYLLPGSPAIDSSIDSLLDRATMVSVRNPLGIPPSPILAPTRDASGQLRIDDPNAVSPGGSGENVYKDRGALDRSDFVGPTSFLLMPLDNGPDDGDASVSKVVLGNASLSSFEIQLSDLGLGMDDNSVISQAVTLEDSQGSGYRTLIPGTDYTFSYNPTNSTIILRPTSGIWTVGRDYRITLDQSIVDGTPNVAIRDAAGNLLQPNRSNGTTVYEIFLGTAVDWGDAASTYPVLSSANGASHQIRGNLMLGTNISAETNGQPSALADADNFDDGLVSFNISPGIQSSITVLAQGTGVLDAWLDANKNGIWEASEKLTFTNGNTIGGGVARQLLFNYGSKNDVKGDTALRLRYSSAGIATVTGPAADGEVEDYVVTMLGPKWQNPNNRFDVDGNGFIQSRDALLIVNLLSNYDTNNDGIVNPNVDLPPGKQAPPPYYDVNGDGLISSADALGIVNRLNNPSSPTLASTNYASSSVVYQPTAPAVPTQQTGTQPTSAVDAVFAATAPSSETLVATAQAAAITSPTVPVAPTAPQAPSAPVVSASTTTVSTGLSPTVSRSKLKPSLSSSSSDNSAELAALFTAPTDSSSTSTSTKKKDGDTSSFDDFFSQY